MSDQYLRKASLIVGQSSGSALDLSQLRFSFAVRRGDIQTPNSADVRVYNPAPGTVSALLAQGSSLEFTQIVIQAGYEGSFGPIFQGTIKQVRYGRENQTDTYLDITAADGDSAYNYSTIALSLAAGQTQPTNAVQSIIQSMASQDRSIGTGYIPPIDGNNPLPRGKVLYGMARDEMRKLAENMNCSWSIQDGQIVLIPLTGYLPGQVPVITRQTGMIGMPEVTQSGISVKTLLNPNLKIGQAVKLDNASIQQMRFSLNTLDQAANLVAETTQARINSDGLYYVMQADHTGDTRGQSWYTDLICLAIDASSPNAKGGTSFGATTSNLGPIKRNG